MGALRRIALAAVLVVALSGGCSVAPDRPTGNAPGSGATGSVKVPPVRDLPTARTGPGSPGDLPAGTYRYRLTHDEVVQGLGLGDVFADANAGVWTWTLRDGKWSYVVRLDGELPPGYAGNFCEGYYDVHGSRVDFTTVTVYASGDCASETWLADWQQTDRGLRMDVITDGADLDFLFGSKEWQRIG
jgi:hypothetical protein